MKPQLIYLPKTAYSFIFHFVCKQKLLFFILAFTSAIWAINDAFFPFFLKRIVDALQHFQGNRENIYSALRWTLLFLVLFWIVNEINARIQGIVGIYAFPRLRADIRAAVFSYVQTHSHEYFSDQFAGNIAKKLANLPSSCQNTLEIFCWQFVTAGAGAVLVLIMMWFTQPIFAYILLIWLVLHLSMTLLFMIYGDPLWEIHSHSVTTLGGKIVDVLTNMLTVRLFARTQHEAKNLRRYQLDEIHKAKKAMWVMELARVGMGFSGLFLIFAMIFTLLHGWIHHWVSLGDFTQVGMQTFWIMGWVWFVSYQISIFTREIGTIREALSLIKQKPDILDLPEAQPLMIRQGKIDFEDIHFAYKKRHLVFKNFTVHIPPGQKVGLVGLSGSGKSTFVNLILRFYDLQAGRILIDEQNITEVTQDSLREQIALIPQDPSLFHRSLLDNIRYGRLSASEEEVIQASKLAHCHEFIEKLEDGYHTLVGERGIKLSGGQRQRVAIARAILKNAPILILDEATSALDSVTEKLIQESLQLLMKNKTSIVVAHRLSTLGNMDRILVFHKGRIIEDGRKAELLAAKGHFARLWNMQTDGFLPDS
ncbi:MAG TPA: ABC transporter ATP-binding protein [Gammaproteobacteria bacterium]|nr:ABC transporter ATP-binding protein [Gammaproteobacteria bacterium]